jgi:hypothetical protein
MIKFRQFFPSGLWDEKNITYQFLHYVLIVASKEGMLLEISLIYIAESVMLQVKRY